MPPVQTSDLSPQTSDLRPQTSDLRPQTSLLQRPINQGPKLLNHFIMSSGLHLAINK